ncbi:hypothetical protein, partial [Sulfuracidifex metallicus]|uniref:hypothetical protein n=1 Tax=Sulfuracidifex metallicus TaxID=47303 RepID=UPI002273617B
ALKMLSSGFLIRCDEMKNPTKMISVRVAKTQYQFFLMYKSQLKRELLKRVEEMKSINIKLKPTTDREIYRDLISFRIPYQHYQKLEEIAQTNQVKLSDIVRNILFSGE